MTLDELKARVKIKVDENTPAGVSHSFDEYLEPMLDESASELCDRAPRYLFTPSKWVADTVDGGDGVNIRYDYDNERAIIDTPINFARIYEVKFPMWEKSVFKAISPDNPDYALQQNKHTRAGYGRPVVMLQEEEADEETATYVNAIVCGKCIDGSLPTTLLYITYLTPANMPEKLEEALTWLAASKILQIMEMPNQAQITFANHQAELTNKAR